MALNIITLALNYSATCQNQFLNKNRSCINQTLNTAPALLPPPQTEISINLNCIIELNNSLLWTQRLFPGRFCLVRLHSTILTIKVVHVYISSTVMFLIFTTTRYMANTSSRNQTSYMDQEMIKLSKHLVSYPCLW